MIDTGRLLREELERAGFREGCEACRSAVARGLEACAPHYIPTHHRRRPEWRQGHLFEGET